MQNLNILIPARAKPQQRKWEHVHLCYDKVLSNCSVAVTSCYKNDFPSRKEIPATYASMLKTCAC